MAGEINRLIPLYGELNRIYSDIIANRDFSFEKLKFITQFWQQYSDTKIFEAAILELVLDRPREQYILILQSLKTEIEKNILAYETHTLLTDNLIIDVFYRHIHSYNPEIEAQLEVTRELNEPLNEAYYRYDSIGYREHTAEEEKQAERDYERCKANYEKEKAKLTKLYDLQNKLREESLPYAKDHCKDIYQQSLLFINILGKYLPDDVEEKRQNEPIKSNKQEDVQDISEGLHEYFSMKFLSSIHESCVGEQFETISEPGFYANINLHPCKNKLKIKAREKIRVCYLIFLMSEKLSKQYRDEWRNQILKLLDIDESYYRSKYKEPVSDFPSDSNQKFAKEMESIF